VTSPTTEIILSAARALQPARFFTPPKLARGEFHLHRMLVPKLRWRSPCIMLSKSAAAAATDSSGGQSHSRNDCLKNSPFSELYSSCFRFVAQEVDFETWQFCSLADILT